MLQRRRMEHHVRAMELEHLLQPRHVADVGQHQVRRVEHRPTLDAELHGVEAALVAVEHDQRLGLEACQLATQLAADAATGSGHHHPLAGDVVGDDMWVDVGRLAAEQVFLGDRPDVARHRRGEHVAHRWQHQQRQLGVIGEVVHPTNELAAGARDGEQHCRRAEPPSDVVRARRRCPRPSRPACAGSTSAGRRRAAPPAGTGHPGKASRLRTMSCAASPAPTTMSGAAASGRLRLMRHRRRRLRTAIVPLAVSPVARIGTDRGMVDAFGAHTSTLNIVPTRSTVSAKAISSSKLP